jgi:hypothetical protein
VQKVLEGEDLIFEQRDNLATELDALVARHRSIQVEDPRLLSSLQSSIDGQLNEIAALDAELAALAQEETALRVQVECTVSEKQKLADRLTEIDALLHAATPCDELSVQDLRSQYELQIAIQGWSIVALSQESLSIELCRNRLGPVHLTFSLNRKMPERGPNFKAGVSALLIDSTRSRSQILRHADTLVKPSFRSLPKVHFEFPSSTLVPPNCLLAAGSIGVT